MVLPEEASPSRVQGWICSGWSCHSSGQACSPHELCWCSRECCWKPGTAWPALTFLHLAAEILTKTGKWKGGNSLVCSHLLPCATKPRELEMEEKHSKVNNCVIFGAFFRKFGEAEQPPAFSTQGRSCGGVTQPFLVLQHSLQEPREFHPSCSCTRSSQGAVWFQWSHVAPLQEFPGEMK